MDNEVMSAFTPAEIEYLSGQRLARIATASADGQPDVAVVGFGVDGDDIVSGGLDITKTVRYRHLSTNARATIVIDDLASSDPFTPRGIKVRGHATWRTTAGPSVSASARPRSGAEGSTRAPHRASPGSRNATFLPTRPTTGRLASRRPDPQRRLRRLSVLDRDDVSEAWNHRSSSSTIFPMIGYNSSAILA